MSRTYRFPDRPLNLPAHLTGTVVRCEAIQHALDAASVAHISSRTRSELWSLVSERGCPPAKAVAIVTGAAVWRCERPRIVA